MFLFQKLGYTYKFIHVQKDMNEVIERFVKDAPKIMAIDTETTGLNFMVDKPFIASFGWKGLVAVVRIERSFIEQVFELAKKCDYLFLHNAKYDLHMFKNVEIEVPEDVHLADGMTVARLTNYADDEYGIGLEELGGKYVDPEAKFAGAVIRERMNQLNKDRLRELKIKMSALKDLPAKPMEIIEAYRSRVQFVEHPWQTWFDYIDQNYKQPNYQDVFDDNPNLVCYYAADDIVILIEYLLKSLPVMEKTHGYDGIFARECKLIRVVFDMERNGLRADTEYLKESRIKVMAYIQKVYENLWSKTGKHFSSGQHKFIMDLLSEKYDIDLYSCDVQALERVIKSKNIFMKNKPGVRYTDWDTVMKDNGGNEVYVVFPRKDGKVIRGAEPVFLYTVEYDTERKAPEEAVEIANLIIELRTLDKWLSTYIEGMLNRVVNGRIHTSINNSGAVTGRVSCDLQQQPKEPLLTSDGVELFHPRRAIITDEGTRTFYFDFSQMELRLQAYYTVLVSGGDLNLCRAFVPFEYYSMFTGEKFVLGSDDWDSGEWVDETGNQWKPTDLHGETTKKAFPGITEADPHWDHYRKLGKVANFLKNYAGGVDAIMAQLGVDYETAKALDAAYYAAFPKVRDYQKWVDSQLKKYGYVENLYGRRYYLQNPRAYYKAYNYEIQGGCADIMKDKEIRLHALLRAIGNPKVKMLLPIHDEIQISIPYGEEWIVPKIVEIMNDNKAVMPTIPMLCDTEVTDNNWADKKKVPK